MSLGTLLRPLHRRRPPLPTGSFGATPAAGTITAVNGTVVFSGAEQGTVVCQIGGIWVASLIFEGTLDPTNQGWATVRANQLSADALVTSPTANGLYVLPGGMAQLRVRATAFTSGPVNVNFLGTPAATVSLPVSAVGPGSGGLPSTVRVEDGVGTNLATVAQFHNLDNQALAGTAFGLLTGGVAQLLNASGRLDRQRETGADNIPALGVASGTQQLKSPIATTVSSGATAGSTTATLTATKFTNRGAAAWIGIGSILTFEPGTTNQEQVDVTAVNYGTNVVTFTGLGAGNGLVNTHGNGSPVTAGAYNEARDATTPDGSTGQGFAAGATYLFNTGLNAGSGGWESERSFLGELSGATGAGSAIAQEYEDTAGGPVLASGLASGLRLTPAQSLQGKGRTSAAITGSVAGNTSVVFGSAAATNLILAGWPLLLTGSGTAEVVYTTTTWTPGSSATVPLQSPVVNTGQTTAQWDSYLAMGPALAGFLPMGVGIEEEALYDPVTTLYYLERSATQDNASATNLVMESEALYTHFAGSGMERARSVLGKFLIAGTLTAGPGAGVSTLIFTADPSTGPTPLKPGQAVLLGPVPATAEIVYIAPTYTSGTSVPLATATVLNHAGSTTAQWEAFGWNGPGLAGFLASGMDIDEDAVYDPVTGLFFLERAATQDAVSAQNVVLEALGLSNGATMDRAMEAPAAATAISRTGIGFNAPAMWTANNAYAPLLGNADGSMPTGGFTQQRSASLTRPANTTTYTANTAVANATAGAVQITIANAARLAALSGHIVGATILDQANQTLKGQFELWLFNTTIGTVTNDNANWAPANADLVNFVTVVKFDGGTVGNNAAGAAGNVIFTDILTKPVPFKLPAGSSLFAQLVVRNAYVPVSSEVFVIDLLISQD